MLGFARRNLRGSPKCCKSMAYISLVRFGMEYASTIWDHYLVKVQWKAVRWVFFDYKYITSVTRFLKDLNWKPLADGRQNRKLTLFHKIHTGRVNLNFKENFGLNFVSRRFLAQLRGRVSKCEVEQTRSKQNTPAQIRHYSDNSCLE